MKAHFQRWAWWQVDESSLLQFSFLDKRLKYRPASSPLASAAATAKNTLQGSRLANTSSLMVASD